MSSFEGECEPVNIKRTKMHDVAPKGPPHANRTRSCNVSCSQDVLRRENHRDDAEHPEQLY